MSNKNTKKTRQINDLLGAICLFFCLLSGLGNALASNHSYSIILVNSFNESDFEVRLMYRLMNGIADDETTMVLTVPPYYADVVANLGDDVKKTMLDSFTYQVASLVQNQDDVSFKRIIAIGRHASVFMDHNPTLLPQAERFFLHIDWEPKTGQRVPSDYDPVLSFRQITQTFPDKTDINFVYGSRDLSVDKALVQHFLDNAPAGINVNYYNPMAEPEETLKALKISQPGTPIIYINYKFFERNWEDVHTWLVQQTTHPIFTIFSHNVNRYAGGAVVVPEKLADKAIDIAKGGEVPLQENTVVSTQYNAQQLSMWGIDEYSLPSNAEVVNRKPAVFSYESVLLMVSIFFAVIAMLSAYTIFKVRSHSKKLEHAVALADQANQAKSDFLANMSHEVRTPMNGVLGTLQVLERSALDFENRKLVGKAIYSATTLLTIINDILDYSKIEANKLSLEKYPFSLLEVIESVVSDLSGSADSKGIRLTSEVAEGFSDGWLGDRVRIRQIVLNLVSNAVKFTEKGAVTIAVDSCDEDAFQGVVIQVADTGIGMSEDAQARIVERFVQADSSTTRRFGGTGLGMSITLNLVRLMEGTIDIDSTENKGTCIKVALPLDKTSLDTSEARGEDVDPPNLSGCNILVAEDNAINQAILESMLTPTCAIVDFVENGKLAIEAVEKKHYNLVLMDIHMPEMDGIEAFKLIKQKHPSLPIIALTAEMMEKEVERYLKLGFEEHIGKPLNINTLYQSLGRYQ
ncbi:response regulator [Alteromonas sediminis]|uniref:histidine kinase n=1 Tax=Alteromonas sediminis TaxID=2259342 RepID=A0A3N5ZDY2_9ALTE|nr:ATP-binding protein [Alteromonas sediminis]RPJ68448.1 response regulator [Alteromonas sediminis]